ncbi:unnamed protein product, partial [Discosporangium mesarthrocarpum]
VGALERAQALCDGLGEDHLSRHHERQIGMGWFNLGKALLDSGQPERAIHSLSCGCRLLEN